MVFSSPSANGCRIRRKRKKKAIGLTFYIFPLIPSRDGALRAELTEGKPVGGFSASASALIPSEHAPDILLVCVFLQPRVEMVPPLEEHGLADEFEPRGELRGRVLEEGLEFVGSHVFGVLDLVLVDVEVDGSLDEQDIVN